MFLVWTLIFLSYLFQAKAQSGYPDCTTITGQKCIFPFRFRNITYNECTTEDSATNQPWCPYEVDEDLSAKPQKWDICKTSGCEKPEVLTITGEKCIFPFKFRNITYNECTTVESTTNEPWCPYEVNEDSTAKPQKWNICRVSDMSTSSSKPTQSPPVVTKSPTIVTKQTKPIERVTSSTPYVTPPSKASCEVISGPDTGASCVFPFRYAGVTYTSCGKWYWNDRHYGKFWCSTRTDSWDNHVNGYGFLGFCDCSNSECGCGASRGSSDWSYWMPGRAP